MFTSQANVAIQGSLPLPLLEKSDFPNGSNWLIGPFVLMDMSILIKILKHVFFDQSTWLKWLIWPIHIIKLNNLSQNDKWVLVKWNI